jgi:hypothetical protein
VVRWVNLALAVVLATLLLIELTRSREPGPAAPFVSEAPPVVAQERPGRRSRRMEARLAIEEARRQRLERLRSPAPPGPVLLDSNGQPFRD